MRTPPMGARDWTVPGYGELGELGSGATGRVVAAVHRASHRQVAIKYLAPGLVGDAAFVHRFRAEARLLAALQSPDLVAFHEYVEGPRAAAIVMELVEGMSLRALLDRLGPTTPEAALLVLRGSLRGLGAAHRVGVVHRDYKPDNILVQPDGASRLTDFGVAVAAGAETRAAGTPAYMAPEQWRGTVGPQADVYSATVVFFECLTGHPPYAGSTLPQLAAAHSTAPVPVDQVPEPLRILISDGMAKNPADRPMTAELFAAQLERVATRGYGKDWERRGLLALAAGVAAVAPALAPGAGVTAGTTTGGTSFASTTFGMSVLGAAAVAIVAAGVFAAVQITASAKPVDQRHPAKPPASVSQGAPNDPVGYGQRTTSPSAPSGHTTSPTGHSTSPAPVTTRAAIPVPDVTGRDSNLAHDLLSSKNLGWNPVHEHSDTVPAGTVIRTDPVAGTLVQPHDTVNVYISSGPSTPKTVTVPDVTGMSKSAAVQQLAALGLKVSVVYKATNSYDPDIVTGSDPSAGSTANVGDTVTLTVTKAPTQPSSPPAQRTSPTYPPIQ